MTVEYIDTIICNHYWDVKLNNQIVITSVEIIP